MPEHKGIAENAKGIMLLTKSVNTRGIEYMGMDLERGLSTKEWPYVYHMKAS
jgi:hypothetical protein